MCVVEVPECHEAGVVQARSSAVKAHKYKMHGAAMMALMLVGKCPWA